MSLIYFAHPIDFVSSKRSDVVVGIEMAGSALVQAGHTVYDPGNAWQVGGRPVSDSTLQETNLNVMRSCDVVFAFLPDDVLTIGTVLEIAEATSCGIPVVVLLSQPSVALAGYQPDLIWQFTDRDRAVSAVEEVVARRQPRKPPLGVWRGEPTGGWTWTIDDADVGWSPNPDGPDTAFAVLGQGAQVPVRAHDDDAGFDLFYSGYHTITVPAMGTADVPSNVAIEWPAGIWALLIGRSSTFRSRGLLVNPAVIDPGYRGQLFAIVRNIGPNSVKIEPGERIAQLVPLPALAPDIEIEKVEELTPSERGSNGLGSSGR